jgi:hypothetical protein
MTETMIDQEQIKKYSTRAMKALNDKEIEQETRWEMVSFGTLFYKKDMDFCRDNNLNVTRILRMKFHDWLVEKFGLEE